MITSFFPESLPVNDTIKTSSKSQSLSHAIRYHRLISMRLTMQAILSIGIIAILLAAGCADVKATQKAKDFGTTFGTSAEQQNLIDWFKANYGDPTTNNNQPPRFVLPMVTTGLTQDNMPMDNVQIFPKDGGSVYFLVVYDNFKKGDRINVKWIYLANGNEIASVDQQAGGDFGRLIVEIQKPTSGWGVGKQEITVTGVGASGVPRTAKVDFEIGAEKQTAPLPWEGQGPVTPAEVPSLRSRPAIATIKQPTIATAIHPQSTGTGPWAGTWDTSYGIMQLTQSGDQVTGTYELNSGRISGTVSGSTFTGTWSEGPSSLHPDSSGEVILTLAADGNSFDGKWRYDSTGDWDGWTGTWVSDGEEITTTTTQPISSAAIQADACPYGGTGCNGKCVHLDNDVDNCGSCGNSCNDNMGPGVRSVMCSQGQCQVICNVNYRDCDKDPSNGCEEDREQLMSDVDNCGGCGNICPPDQECYEGRCCYHDQCVPREK
jgi:hypothetical protein